MKHNSVNLGSIKTEYQEWNSSDQRKFVDLSTVIGSAEFSHSIKQLSEQQQVEPEKNSPGFQKSSIVWTASEERPEDSLSQPTTKSKNDIFHMSFTIDRPFSTNNRPTSPLVRECIKSPLSVQMKGLPVPSCVETLLSSTTTAFSPTMHTPAEQPYKDSQFTGTVRKWIDLEENDEMNILLSPLEPNPKLPMHYKSMITSIQNKTAPNLTVQTKQSILQTRGSSELVLAFLPTANNFLGEGRYSQVFRGHYSLTLSSTSSDDSESEFTTSLDFLSLATSTNEDLSIASSTNENTVVNPEFPSITHQLPPQLEECAVKQMRYTAESQATAISEIYVLRKLSHPNIIKLIGVKTEQEVETPLSGTFTPLKKLKPHDVGTRILTVLSYESNGSVGSWIERNKSKVGHLLWTRWASQLSSALAYIHSKGLIHHDIKIHNVLLDDRLDAKLSDFGNACFVPNSSPTIRDYIHESSLVLSDQCDSPTSTLMSLDNSDTASQYITPISHPLSYNASTHGASNTCASAYNASTTNTASTANTATTNTASSHGGRGSPVSPPLNTVSPLLNTLLFSSKNCYMPGTSLNDGVGRGTLAYTAPEIFSRDGIYSFPSDVYSLGVTLYVLTTGQEPFTNVKSPVFMINYIKKGFFECGMQVDPFPDGPIPGVSRFMSGELIPEETINFIIRMVALDPLERPTAIECAHFFGKIPQHNQLSLLRIHSL